MAAIDKLASRAWRSRLRDVLNTVWDPIGNCPPDEYDSYAGKIAALVREGASDSALSKYLIWAETENMDMTWSEERRLAHHERLARTIAAIRALGPISKG